MGEILNENSKPIIKVPKPEYIWFNENTNRKKILEFVLAGKPIEEIQRILGIKEHTVVYTMNHPHFINKLNKKLQVMYTFLVVDKVRIQSELLQLLYGSINKSLPPKRILKIKDEKMLKELVSIIKSDTNRVKISKVEKNTSFIFNNNLGKERPMSEEKEAEKEKK
jgi:hypothetical protein